MAASDRKRAVLGAVDAGAAAYWRDGYRVVEALVTAEQCTMLRTAMDHARDNGHMRADDSRAYAGPHNQYAPLPAQLILAALRPRVAALVGRDLLPSYAFWRIYTAGDRLNPHTDRLACEVAITVALAAEPAGHVWPIGIRDVGGVDRDVELSPGAGLIYQGAAVLHWRAPFSGHAQYQMFLNYVLADGPNAHLAHDEGRARMR